MRVDVMAKMRGVAPFEELWSRRTTVAGRFRCAYRAHVDFPDLVAAKKTQRDKDWPMIRRLVEAHHAQHGNSPVEDQVRFWLRESRTADMLCGLAARYPELWEEISDQRPILRNAILIDRESLERALRQEEFDEREVDRRHWQPLRQELEQLRQGRRQGE